MDDDAHDSSGPAGEVVAWTVLGYVISGPALYGGLGWLADRWLGTDPVFLAIGLIGGMALGLLLVWYRYGTPDDRRPPAASPDAGQPDE